MSKITKKLLESNGFKDVSTDKQKEFWKLPDEEYFCMKFDYKDKIHITFDNACCNTAEIWDVHIDNCDFDSIANIELSTTGQFNKLMEIIKSDFRL